MKDLTSRLEEEVTKAVKTAKRDSAKLQARVSRAVEAASLHSSSLYYADQDSCSLLSNRIKVVICTQ